jgi:hypothetical protein
MSMGAQLAEAYEAKEALEKELASEKAKTTRLHSSRSTADQRVKALEGAPSLCDVLIQRALAHSTLLCFVSAPMSLPCCSRCTYAHAAVVVHSTTRRLALTKKHTTHAAEELASTSKERDELQLKANAADESKAAAVHAAVHASAEKLNSKIIAMEMKATAQLGANAEDDTKRQRAHQEAMVELEEKLARHHLKDMSTAKEAATQRANHEWTAKWTKREREHKTELTDAFAMIEDEQKRVAAQLADLEARDLELAKLRDEELRSTRLIKEGEVHKQNARDWEKLLRYLAVKTHVRFYQLRKRLMHVYTNVSGLMLMMIQNRDADAHETLALQSEIDTWYRESQSVRTQRRITAIVDHLGGVEHVLRHAIHQAQEREQHWRLTAHSFFERNGSLQSQKLTYVRDAEEAAKQAVEHEHQVNASLRQQYGEAQGANRALFEENETLKQQLQRMLAREKRRTERTANRRRIEQRSQTMKQRAADRAVARESMEKSKSSFLPQLEYTHGSEGERRQRTAPVSAQAGQPGLNKPHQVAHVYGQVLLDKDGASLKSLRKSASALSSSSVARTALMRASASLRNNVADDDGDGNGDGGDSRVWIDSSTAALPSAQTSEARRFFDSQVGSLTQIRFCPIITCLASATKHSLCFPLFVPYINLPYQAARRQQQQMRDARLAASRSQLVEPAAFKALYADIAAATASMETQNRLYRVAQLRGADGNGDGYDDAGGDDDDAMSATSSAVTLPHVHSNEFTATDASAGGAFGNGVIDGFDVDDEEARLAAELAVAQHDLEQQLSNQ